MVFSVTHTICKGPKLDAWRSQRVKLADRQFDSIRQHEYFLKCKNIWIKGFGVAHKNPLDDSLCVLTPKGPGVF